MLALRYSLVLSASCLLASPRWAQVTLDFEGLPATPIVAGDLVPLPGSVLTDDYVGDGVIFGRDGVSLGVAVGIDSFAPSSGVNSVVGLDENGIIPGTSSGAALGDIYFRFVLPGTTIPGESEGVTFTIGDAGGDVDEFIITSYDSGDNQVDSRHVMGDSRFLVALPVPVHRVEIYFLGTAGYSLDDLHFSTPEGPTCFTLDFETDDSGQTMVHGTRVDSEFDGDGVFPVITGSVNDSGMNTAAILDSSTGPALQDPDLLVGNGNILILQTDANTSECPPGSGVFCSHNDDEDGGLLRFSWGTRPVRALSLVLVDIDATDGLSRVVLTDESGANRTYSVPADWTGDLVTDGTSGTGTLDLTTLADQIGFGSSATASEDAAFDPERVVQIDVQLGGSGGVDDVVFCPSKGMFRPTVAIRNGSGVNPMNLSSVTLPRLGTTWIADLDCRSFGSGTAFLIIRASENPGALCPFGEELVRGAVLYGTSRAFHASSSQLGWDVPADVSLVGRTVHAQGFCQSEVASFGSRPFIARGRLSNALDLTLGF